MKFTMWKVWVDNVLMMLSVLSQTPHYRYVLTGKRGNQFLMISGIFIIFLFNISGWVFFILCLELTTLSNINPEDVNKKLSPFFWRTNKQELHVLKPDLDIIKEISLSKKSVNYWRRQFVKIKTDLWQLIRLLQAFTNPELLVTNINYKKLGLVDVNYGVLDK